MSRIPGKGKCRMVTPSLDAVRPLCHWAPLLPPASKGISYILRGPECRRLKRSRPWRLTAGGIHCMAQLCCGTLKNVVGDLPQLPRFRARGCSYRPSVSRAPRRTSEVPVLATGALR